MLRVFDAVANDVRKLIVLLIILAVPFAALGVGLTATSVIAGHDDPNELHACYAPWGKIMRYTDDPEKCAVYEDVVNWNQQGIQGDQGDPGISGWERVSTTTSVGANTIHAGLAVNCPAGKNVLGGGVETSTSAMIVLESYPPLDTRWSASIHNQGTVAENVTTWAICAYVSP